MFNILKNTKHFIDIVNTSKTGIFVTVFYSADCPPCVEFKTELESISKNKYKDRVQFILIDTHKHTELTSLNKITATPTTYVFFFDKEKEIIKYISQKIEGKNIPKVLELCNALV